MKYFINYANKGFLSSQRIGIESAKDVGFDECIPYSVTDIDPDFYQKNLDILSSSRGAGYWLWKPYLILKTLNQINENDYLVYMDSGSRFLFDPSIYLDMIDEKGVLAFSMIHKNFRWTKGDCFYHINKEDKLSFAEEDQLQATYIFFRKNKSSLDFVSEWLDLCLTDNLITDDPNKVMQNLPGFIDHRHDQSIFSLLAYNHQIKNVPQIDQYCVEHGLDISRKIVDRHGVRS